MQFVKPMPFQEALEKLGSQSPIGAALSSSEWSDLPLELRESAFFSANVESLRFLQQMQDSLFDFLSGNTKTLDDGQTMLATGSRAAFVDQMQRMLAAAGIERTTGGLTDITSQHRLGLIFDIKTQQANSYGYWKQGMDPDVLNVFPASRFIRVRDVKEPRLNHVRFEDQVYLKTDPIWWLEINKDFGVPWKPFGWGCGHDMEDVDRDEAEKLHLLAPGQRLDTAPLKRFMNFNKNLQASAHGIEPELLAKMKDAFGNQIRIEGDVIYWNKPVADVNAQAPAALSSGGNQRTSPVSAAIELKVYGKLEGQVEMALAAIDHVHDDGALDKIKLVNLNQPYYGVLKPKLGDDGGLVADYLAVRASGPWPGFTAIHEIGHLLDLMVIGGRGSFASAQLDSGMAKVISAARETEAVSALLQSLQDTDSAARQTYLKYLLEPHEIWARAYAQFIAERSEFPALQKQLKLALESEKNRQWTAEDFKPVSSAIEAMFKTLGWL